MKRAVVLAVLCAMWAPAACGSGGVVSRPALPVPAPSTSAFSPQFKGGGDRTIDVFLKDSVTVAQRDAMAGRIAAMPEVEVYAYVTKAQALQQFKDTLGKKADDVLRALPSDPLPASFRIIVKDTSQVRAVASRFYRDPAVDSSPSSPGGHDGVVARWVMTH
jgi:hypothetical protein